MLDAQTAAPLVLTLKLDRASFATLNELRQRHFPRARNVLPAHLTLFHALPGAEERSIRAELSAICPTVPVMPLGFPRPLSLGRGVAIAVECPPLRELRAQLAREWAGWLTAQDRQPLRPHVTIQNKVEPDLARRLYAELADGWRPFEGTGEGLLLWRYVGGPWEGVGEFGFAAP